VRPSHGRNCVLFYTGHGWDGELGCGRRARSTCVRDDRLVEFSPDQVLARQVDQTAIEKFEIEVSAAACLPPLPVSRLPRAQHGNDFDFN
jgi:hypothetical protein